MENNPPRAQPPVGGTAYISFDNTGNVPVPKPRQATNRSPAGKVVAGEFPREETVPMRPPAFPHFDLAPRPVIAGVRLQFEPSVPMAEVADTLELARLAAESLHGPERLALEARWDVDVDEHAVAIDTSAEP